MVHIKNNAYPNHSNYNDYFEWFDFPLSDFQKYSIEAIIEGNHSLVTAHTGSGKTLPAEFAIRYFHENCDRRVIYTAPIKALSNQKYYDFSQKFPHISFGVITGDVKFNPDANVLIMTTEVLENCLRGGKNISVDFSEVAAVIFDEVHYINDAERGGVWENTMLLLPKEIQLIMLSATIDAPEKFAQWIEERYPTCEKCVVLSSTDKRVVPLVHYSYITTNEIVYKTTCKGNKELEQFIRANTNNFSIIKSEKGEFQEKEYNIARRVKTSIKDVKINRQHVLNQLVVKLRNEDMMPAIMFVFSRKMVEQYASEITANLFMAPLVDFDPTAPRMDIYDDSKIPYVVARECEQLLRAKIVNYREYLELPEYKQLVSLLEKGIAIHHSGMIPILREIVEFMISRKYVKLLFATESFAIGLDCPIKTAVFTSLTKFDGNHERLLYPHEYSQMAGRAGRRGMDKIGHVIHCNNMFDLPTATEYREIMCGKPQKLQSKFNIDYKLVLKNTDEDGSVNTSKIKNFIQKSMLYGELIEEYNYMVKEQKELCDNIENKKLAISFQKTPMNVCIDFIETEQKIPGLVNKKRREKERYLSQLSENYPSIKQDINRVKELIELEKSMENMEVKTIDQYTEDTIQNEIDRLGRMGYIKDGKVTYMGEISRVIGELNGLEISYVLLKYITAADLSIDEILGILYSIIDVPEDKDAPPMEYTIEDNVTQILNSIKNDGIKVKKENVYYMNEWLERGEILISKGEWIKSIKKLCNVIKEIESVVIELELKSKLCEMDKRLKKYVVSDESLYI